MVATASLTHIPALLPSNEQAVTFTIGDSGTPATASGIPARVSGTTSRASGKPRGCPRINPAPESNVHETAQALLLAAQIFAAAIVKEQAAKSGEKKKRGRPPTLRRVARAIFQRRGPGRPLGRPRKVETVPTPEIGSEQYGEKRKPASPVVANNELSATTKSLEEIEMKTDAVEEKAPVSYIEKRRPDRPRKVYSEQAVDKKFSVTFEGTEGAGGNA